MGLLYLYLFYFDVHPSFKSGTLPTVLLTSHYLYYCLVKLITQPDLPL